MRPYVTSIIVLSATLLSVCHGFGITQTNNANSLADAIFGQGVTALNGAAFSGSSASSGTFSDGPFGIGSGGIFTTGAVSGASSGGNNKCDNGAPGGNGPFGTDFCPDSFNTAILRVPFAVDNGYNGVRVQFILASEEK